MVALIDIEPGMVVAGRYVVSTVDRRWLEDNPQAGAVCTALDAILDEPVLIHVADADGSTDVLEAARRVSILGDHRIAPTLDVGHSNGLDYVVSKRIAVTALGEILPKSPLPIDAACALIGEIGTVLVTAARRGLFHMFLRPNTVGITTKGTVLVSGIGIDAALALGTGVIQPEDYTPTQASREDALGLIRLFYAAITGYWPAEEAFNGIPAAGRENSRIARAKSLNPEISNELDDFVSGILTGSDPGPGSVAEVLGFLDEWDAELLRYVNRTPVPDNDSVFNHSPHSFDEATSLPTPRSTSIGGSGSTTASDDQVKAALVRIGITRPGTRGLAAGVGGKMTGQYADRMQMREASSFPIGKEQLDNAAQDWEEWEPEQTYSEYSAYAEHEYDENLTSPIMDRDAQESDPDTQSLDFVSDDGDEEPEDENDTRVIMDDEDDGSWFLGGMFETSEQQREHQLREYERERRIAQAKEDEARRRIAALEEASTAKRQEANAAAPPKQVRRLSPQPVDEPDSDSTRTTAPVPAVSADQGSANQGSDVSADHRSDDTSGATAAAAGAAGVAGASAAAGTVASSGSKGSSGKKQAGAGGKSAGDGAGRSTAGSSAVAAGDSVGGGSGGGSGNGGGGDDDPANSRKPFAWLVLALVVIAAIVISIAVFSFTSDDTESETAPETPTPTETEEPTETKSEEPTPDPPKIDTVTALDPEGDGEENDDAAEDVKPKTEGSWRTDRYNSAEFGNLKSGVGLLFEFEDKTTIKEVKVKSSNSGGVFEILKGSDPEDAEKVGEGEFDSDDVTVKLDDDVETDELILWVTELPQDDDGHRAIINTVDFK